MTRRVPLLVTVAASLLAILLPVSVHAAGSTDVALTGTFSDGAGSTGAVGGVLTIEGFADGGGIVANGTATFSLCVPGVDPKNCLATLTQIVQIRVVEVEATCSLVTIDLASFMLVSPPSLAGFTLDFDAIELHLLPVTPAGSRAACTVGRLLDQRARDATIARLLDRLLAAG